MKKNNYEFRNSVILLSGNIVTVFGNILLSNALNLWIIRTSGNTKTLGIIASIGLLPTLLFTILGGAISDRFNKKKIVVFCDFISGVLCLLMGFSLKENYINIPLIIVFRLLLSVIKSFFNPAIRSLPAYSISK